MTGTTNIHPGIQDVIDLFSQEGLAYVLFKCEHVFKGENKNLDVLLPPDDYARAAAILKKHDFVLYMSEKVESYKQMFIQFSGGIVTAVHLHREIAWHGIIVLDARQVLLRASSHIPSAEDSLLIHVAHALFENFKLSPFHKGLIEDYHHTISNEEYLFQHASRFGWDGCLHSFLKSKKLLKRHVVCAYLSRLWQEPHLLFPLGWKLVCALRRAFFLRGFLLVLIGPNGTGKSTTKTELLKKYSPLSRFIAGHYGYYLGWKKSLLSRVLSPLVALFRKEPIFVSVSKEQVKSFDLFQEILFLYVYCEYLWRYCWFILPAICRGKLVITDRYFYDLWGQYPYSSQSRMLPLLKIPRADTLVVLDADTDIIANRGKHGAGARIVQPKEKLEGQRQRYGIVARRFNGVMVKTTASPEKTADEIIALTWRKYVHGINKSC